MVFRLCLLLCLSLSCYLRSYPLHPGIVTQATYKVFSDTSQGTAWVVDKRHLVTAGHVCETQVPTFTIVGPIRRYQARAILWEKSNDGAYDLCLLRVDTDLEGALVIADKMPAINDPVTYVGYPEGEFTVSSGVYLGDLDGPALYNDAVFTAVCGRGASGSAVYTDRGVWGVLVRLRTDGGYIHDPSEGCVAIPLDKLRKFLDDADVNYDVPPEVPENPFAPLPKMGA